VGITGRLGGLFDCGLFLFTAIAKSDFKKEKARNASLNMG